MSDALDLFSHIECLTLDEVRAVVASRVGKRPRRVSRADRARAHCDDLVRAELELVPAGCGCVAGVDEAGRGPLAGPVVAAAVVFSEISRAALRDVLAGIDDSKRLSPQARESLFLAVTEAAEAVSVGIATSEEIDRLNILKATHLAMRRAVEGLGRTPTLALVDGNSDPGLPCRTQCIVRGDAQVFSISAASVVAKVTRDVIMESIHSHYPEYGFDANKGYPTSSHYRALACHGPCPVHRISYRLSPRE